MTKQYCKKSKPLFSAILVVLLIAMSPFLLTSAQAPSDVTVPGQNLQRTYYSDGSAPNDSNLLWRFQMDAPPGEFACIVVNGVVYQGCLGTGDVYAVNEATGQQIWHRVLNNTANSLTYYNGLVYTQGGSLPYDPVSRSFGDLWIALDAQTGDTVWTYQIPPNEWAAVDVGTYGQPPIIVDGKMYIAVYNGIATLNASTGQEIDRWTDIIPASFFNTYNNGITYGVARNQTDGRYYAFSADVDTKTLNWISKDNPVTPFGYPDVGGGTFSGVAFSDDLFVGEYNFSSGGSTPNHIFRIRANDGALAWVFPIEGYVTNSLAVAYNNVYAATSTGNVYAVGKTEGTSAVWTYKTGPVYTPIVVADQKVFFGSEDTYVYALDAATGELIWRYRTGGAIIGSPVIANGKLFVASRDHFLYAFGPAPPKPASALTISAPNNIPTGEAITINGRLTDTDGAPIVLANLTLQQRIVPRSDYTNITVLTTDANGNYTYNWTPPVDGYYDLNVLYAGDGSAASSAMVTVSVGSTESTVDAINRLQNTITTLLIIILAVAVIAAILSALALIAARRRH